MYNPDGERLAGELTAESLDRQIRGGGTDTDVRASQLRAGMEGAASSGGGQRLGAAAGGSDAEHRSEAELEAEEERYGQFAYAIQIPATLGMGAQRHSPGCH
mgnify:FL=1